MKLVNSVAMIFGLLSIGAAIAPSAFGDDWNKKTTVTFSAPVQTPGVHLAGWDVLPAGTYVFKLLDSLSNRHIVQIFSADEKTVYATILAIPNYRLQATDKTVMSFREQPEGQPEALRAWFYPGSNSGEEFVYPKAKALALAKATQTPVLFVPDTVPVEVAEPVKSADAPVVVELKSAPIMAITPAGDEVPASTVVAESRQNPAASTTPEPAPAPASMAAPAASTLPATASSLPLLWLVGVLSLIGAFAARAFAVRLQ